MSSDVLARLSLESLRAIAQVLDRTGRLPDAIDLRATGKVPSELIGAVVGRLRRLNDDFASPRSVGRVLVLIADDRERERKAAPRIEVVWSGPEAQAPRHRTTLALVQELFETFEHRLLLSTYAIDVDRGAEKLFGGLAKRMEREPSLEVELFLDVRRTRKGESPEVALARFRERFRQRIWPGKRLPRVWFDPRSLKHDQRAVLHAKCVVADERVTLVTSANFTGPAHDSNVELGLSVTGEAVARRVLAPFRALVAQGQVQSLF